MIIFTRFINIFYWYVYKKPFSHLLKILNDFKLIYWQTEKSQASVFLPLFEGPISLWFPW